MRALKPSLLLGLASVLSLACSASGAARRSCAADSAAATLEYELMNAVLLDKAMHLPDTLETGWLEAVGLPNDSAPAEVRRRWATMWYTLIVNCTTIPDSVRRRFARQVDLDEPPPSPDAEANSRYLVKLLPIWDTRFATATVGSLDGGRKYHFARQEGRWELLNLPVEYPTCPASRYSRRVSGVMRDKVQGAPITGGQVLVAGTECGALTDRDGRWVLPGAPPMAFVLKASFIGYKDVNIAIASSRHDSTGIQFDLEYAPPYLEF